VTRVESSLSVKNVTRVELSHRFSQRDSSRVNKNRDSIRVESLTRVTLSLACGQCNQSALGFVGLSTPSFIILPSGVVSAVTVSRYCVVQFFFFSEAAILDEKRFSFEAVFCISCRSFVQYCQLPLLLFFHCFFSVLSVVLWFLLKIWAFLTLVKF